MVLASDRFAPNRATVASESVDGIAILINLSTGTYYSMEESAATVWASIEQQRSAAEIATALTTTYDVAWERASADVERLLGELLREDLVVPVASAPTQGGPQPSTAGPATGTALLPYQPPRLDIFSDLSPLLANDPPTLIPPLHAHD